MSNIQQRAATFFGADRDPRRTIKISRYKVLVVVPRGELTSMGIYSEEGRGEPRGQFVFFDKPVAEQIIEALR